MAKYDWDKVKDDYIYGYIDNNGQKIFPSQSQLSKKHNIPKGTISARAAKDEWEAEKQAKTSKILDKVEEKKTEYEAEKIVQSDDKFEDAGELIRRVGVKKLNQIEKDLDKKTFVRSIDIVNVASAIKAGQDIVKTAQGEITDRIKLDSNSDVNLTILNDDFQKEELSFMQKLIKK